MVTIVPAVTASTDRVVAWKLKLLAGLVVVVTWYARPNVGPVASTSCALPNDAPVRVRAPVEEFGTAGVVTGAVLPDRFHTMPPIWATCGSNPKLNPSWIAFTAKFWGAVKTIVYLVQSVPNTSSRLA